MLLPPLEVRWSSLHSGWGITGGVLWCVRERGLAAIMHDVAHFSGLLSERAVAVRPAGSV